jgi:serine/tyrosine/threonine adenylyltransferase
MTSFYEYYQTHNDNSYVRQLHPDPETKKNHPNQETRSVESGHYVESVATPLSDPYMITYNDSLARQLKIPDSMMRSNIMLKYLSGYNKLTDCMTRQTLHIMQHVTPYALSIYGQRTTKETSPFYGDGRAHSIGEFVVKNQRWELQLKGSGTTPFSRSLDGRAVLRSSVREYLASEAMHALGVPTTRALSLIVGTEKVERSWYRLNTTKADSERDIVNKNQKSMKGGMCQIQSSCGLKNNSCGNSKQTGDYNQTNEMNPVAIVCRVCSSFIRVGHIELFGIRAEDSKLKKDNDKRLLELKLMFEHMVFREYPQFVNLPIDDAIMVVCDEFAVKISTMVSHWMRVGYVQSNFNSDNCLVSGKTLDYGPFGFMEKYDPDKNFWIGSGQHFGFMNQLNAAKRNYISFVNSLKPLLDHTQSNRLDESINKFDTVSVNIMNNMWARKLGLITLDWKNDVNDFLKRLLNLMRFADFDYTIFWRELSNCPMFIDDMNQIFACMSRAFYNNQISDDWKTLFQEYVMLLKKEQRMCKNSFSTISRRMKLENPKYVPREWMLVQAYTDAQNNSFEFLIELQELFKTPYDEHPDMEDRYYKLTPLEIVEDKPGYSSMSCSS